MECDACVFKQLKDFEYSLDRWRLSLSCVSLNEKKSSVLVFGGVDKDGYKQSLTTILEFGEVERHCLISGIKMT